MQARRASLLARQGKMKEARELIRRVPEQSPGDARAKLLAEAAAAARPQDVGRGRRRCWPQANKAFPDDADLLYEQAMIDEKLDRLDEMERLLRRVIELKPDHQHAYNALGYSLAERKIRLPEARELIQKALELSPGEPFITDSLGWVEYRLGNRDEALRLLRGAYQSRPDPEIAAHLGEVLWSDRASRRSAPRLARGALARRARTTCCGRRWRACASTCDPARPMPRPQARVAPSGGAAVLACAASSPPARRCRRRRPPAETTFSGRLARARRGGRRRRRRAR